MRDALKERIYRIARTEGFQVEKLYTLAKGWRIVINREGDPATSRTISFVDTADLAFRLKNTL